jgi:GNAT superfamily N-acetyltransferase
VSILPYALETGCRPQAAGGIVSLHEAYYSKAWGFGAAFRDKVSRELSEFLSRFDPELDFQANAFAATGLVGSITLDVTGGGPDGAHLRWFIVDDQARGTGLGRKLMASAIAHCDRAAKGKAWLTTFAGLDAARALYEAHGFRLKHESDVDQWSGGVREQLFLREPPVAGAAL